MVLFTGRTVEEAIEKGLNEMQLTRLKAHIKVVSREKHGFLGFGKKPAQVDIEGINEVTAHRADQKAVRGVPDTINQQNTPVSSQLEDTLELRKISGIIKQMEERGEKIDDEVKELPHLFMLSGRMMTTIKLNMIFSMTLNFVAIALAIAGILNPVIGALVHNAGSVLVIINSALLLKWEKKKKSKKSNSL